MKKIVAALIIIPAVALLCLYAYIIYNGPRMKEQPHIRAYQTVVPLPPQGLVTVEDPQTVPSPVRASKMTNPLPATNANLQRGKIYYHYYCVFCHGKYGNGNGPVGDSFMPRPARFDSERVRQYGDGELLRAMLVGIGHEPVLARVVPLRHRWYLVLYVRSLGRSRPG